MLRLAGLVRPSNDGIPARADFENAIKGHATPEILNPLLPRGTPDTYVPGPRTPDGGFKFEWQGDGGRWVVWGHGPETQAPQGEAAATEWTLRVQCANQFLTYLPIGTGPGRQDFDNPTRWVNGRNAQFTHIPFTLSPRTVGRVV